MSAIARVMHAEGHEVSGCDLRPSTLTDEMAGEGIAISQGHAPEHLDGIDTLVLTAAVHPDNPEVQAAQERGIPIVKRAQMLGKIMESRHSIAVAGTHGKTTTSAAIAFMLVRAGLDPTLLIGGEMLDLRNNARLGQGSHLVAEADEFDGAFLHLSPSMAVITNIEPEHLDYYGTYEAVLAAFTSFATSVIQRSGTLVVCGDDPGVRRMLGSLGEVSSNIVSYGLAKGNRWQAERIEPRPDGGVSFAAYHEDALVGEFSLVLSGRHNVLNALAAVAVGHGLGLEIEAIREALASFHGTKRRFEVKGQVGGVTIVDDYAHHPTEIRATLRAARERYDGRRITCVFQPHTYSRTKLLLDEFATCFSDADEVIVIDIYPAREENTWGISSEDLVRSLRHPRARYGGSLEQVETALGHLRPGDVLLNLGAGDIYKLSEALLTGGPRG